MSNQPSGRARSKRERQCERRSDFTVIRNNSDATSSSPQQTLFRHETVASSDGRNITVRNRYFGIFQTLTDKETWKRLGSLSLHPSSGRLVDVEIVDHNGNFDPSELGFEPLDPIWRDPKDEDNPEQRKKKKSRKPGDLLKEWVEEDRDRYLHEILRLEGRGEYAHKPFCYSCDSSNAEYRCSDCDQIEMFCKTCLVSNHTGNPLHCIKKWNGVYFERSSLKALGLRVQLGHMTGQRCVNPRGSAGDSFVVVHSNGIHDLSVDFCDCESAQTHTIQLLRHRWFPSSGVYPKTASTFQVLKQFHLLAFESKISTYEFYNSLARSTDNTGLYTEKDRYDEFMRMYRKWSNLTMAKRAARGHNPEGIRSTKEGECALLCPACPQPGKNLPSGWETEPPEKGWIYSLYLAIDANFRLTRRTVSSDEDDPGLGDGWAFFVKNIPYQEHLKKYWDVKQPRSTCVNHEACNNSEKEVHGKLVTGGGTADCARHNFKRACGFTDLQKGERYLNMDYLVFSSLRQSIFQRIFFSYDIACQWYKNLWERMKILPPDLRLNASVKDVTYLVPKFHIAAHIEQCIRNFSFNTTRYVGRTDGEAPERGWSGTNALAASTKEMGPGFRRDTLDSHFNDWNWKKITALGASLLKKIKAAVPQAVEHVLQLRQMERVVSATQLQDWRNQVEKWEKDVTAPNPYQAQFKTVTEQEVRLALAINASTAEDIVVHSNVHPSILISQGLQLEDNQRKLAKDVADLGQHATSNQMRTIQESSNKLRRQINAWIEIQTLYMPHTASLRQQETNAMPEGVPAIKTENIPLHLPSSLSPNHPCNPELQIFEWKLRQGQAFDALHEMRQNLRVSSHYIKYKIRFSRGVAQNTRSNTTIKNLQDKAKRGGQKYRIARAAMVNLSPRVGGLAEPGWQNDLKVLQDADIRGLSEGVVGESQGKRTVLWIWLTEGMAVGDDDEKLNEALRIEWCQTRARSMRFQEEVELLQEEMRRTVAFLEWQAEWWEAQGGSLDHVVDKVAEEGLVAYRRRQAALRRSICERFKSNWADVPKFVELGNEALQELDEPVAESGP